MYIVRFMALKQQYFENCHRKQHLLCSVQLDTGRCFSPSIHFSRILVARPPQLFSPPGKMSAPVVLRNSGPALCSSFAEVCAFLKRYGAALDLPEMTFTQVERYLRDTSSGERSLVVFVSEARKSSKAATFETEGVHSTTIIIAMRMKMKRNLERVARYCGTDVKLVNLQLRLITGCWLTARFSTKRDNSS